MDDYIELTDRGIKLKDDTLMTEPCFNEVYKRDNTTDKRVAFQELHYVFQVCDIRSSSIKKGYKGKQLITDAKKVCRLDNSWKPDVVLNECIEFYKNDRSNVVIESYRNLLSGLRSSIEVVNFLDDTLRHKLAKLRDTDADVKDEDGNVMLSSEAIKIITTAVKEILSLSVDIPKRVQDIEQIKENALASNRGSGVGRGGTVVNDSMDPANSVSHRH